MKAWQRGIWAGILATGPMTLVMLELQRRLPARERSPLPPATITRDLLVLFPKGRDVSPEARQNLTFLNHFGFGAVCGMLYALSASRLRQSSLATGTLFGVGVWAASYLGWIPAFGLRASAYHMPARRNLMMIAAHVAWGAALGLVDQQIREKPRRYFDGAAKAVGAE